jgi:hypothetical protein
LKNLRRIAGAFESPGQWLPRFCQAVEKHEIAMNCGLTEGNEGNKGNPMGPFLFTSFPSLPFVKFRV